MQSVSLWYPLYFSAVFTVVLSYPAGPAYSKPAQPQQGAYYSPNKVQPTPYQGSEKDARILSYSFDLNPVDSSFQHSHETDNGLSAQAHGYLKGDIQVIEGSYLTFDAEGKPSQITYIADENGYQPSGPAIPQINPIIEKAIAYLKSLPSSTPPPQYPSQYYKQSNYKYTS